MEFDEFLEKYIKIIEDIRKRDIAELDALTKYVDIIGNLKIDESDIETLKEQLNKYFNLMETENKAIDDFVNSIKIIASISKGKNEIHDEIKVLVEKFQERSLEQIESQPVNK